MEDHAGIAGGEIVRGDHLANVAAGGAEREDAGWDHRAKTEVEASPGGEEANDREAETCRADFDLEQAVRPADERGCLPTEKDVCDEVVEVGDADCEEEIPRQKLFHD